MFKPYLKYMLNPALEEACEAVRAHQEDQAGSPATRRRVEAGRGAEHDTFRLGSVKIPIPRHAEIGHRTTEDILHECEAELGKGWWRN
jgi:hypothetical protein